MFGGGETGCPGNAAWHATCNKNAHNADTHTHTHTHTHTCTHAAAGSTTWCRPPAPRRRTSSTPPRTPATGCDLARDLARDLDLANLGAAAPAPCGPARPSGPLTTRVSPCWGALMPRPPPFSPHHPQLNPGRHMYIWCLASRMYVRASPAPNSALRVLKSGTFSRRRRPRRSPLAARALAARSLRRRQGLYQLVSAAGGRPG